MKNKFEFNHFTKSPLFLLQIFNLLSKTLFTLKCFIQLYALDQGEGILLVMAYMGRLCQKGVPFPGFRYMKGYHFIYFNW